MILQPRHHNKAQLLLLHCPMMMLEVTTLQLQELQSIQIGHLVCNTVGLHQQRYMWVGRYLVLQVIIVMKVSSFPFQVLPPQEMAPEMLLQIKVIKVLKEVQMKVCCISSWILYVTSHH